MPWIITILKAAKQLSLTFSFQRVSLIIPILPLDRRQWFWFFSKYLGCFKKKENTYLGFRKTKNYTFNIIWIIP